jgi:hypothetical protein
VSGMQNCYKLVRELFNTYASSVFRPLKVIAGRVAHLVKGECPGNCLLQAMIEVDSGAWVRQF